METESSSGLNGIVYIGIPVMLVGFGRLWADVTTISLLLDPPWSLETISLSTQP